MRIHRPVADVVALLSAALLAGAALAEPAPPIGVEIEPQLTAELIAAHVALGAGFTPRTELRDADGGPAYVNRLILEASPYLRLHAHQPIDWRPWNDATLAAARETGKPIFLSIGYSSCHWCHVMAEESFDNAAVATALNRDFIAIKVDREELPEIDELYMTATAALTGGGGWPNSLWLTPDGAPIHAATYLPTPEFQRVLTAVALGWRADRPGLEDFAARLQAHIAAIMGARFEAGSIDGDVHAGALVSLQERFNPRDGGFSDQVQFPLPLNLLYLLDRWRRSGDARALEIAEVSLDAIVAGALHDHVGGGFHRYAVDPSWRMPHFEKMLYSQALIARALVDGWRASGKPAYARAARRTLDYVLRELTAPDGAFYAAEDADSLTPSGERSEGAFYLWNRAELTAALGESIVTDALIDRLGVETQPRLELGGAIHLERDGVDQIAALDPVFEQLRRARAERARPFRDEKIIAAWNGLMLRALVEAGEALAAPDYIAAADRAGDALWLRLWREVGLRRFAIDGEIGAPATLFDYAALGLGYVALSDATGSARHAERARILADAIEPRFADADGRLHMAAGDGGLGPIYETSDGATPSGASAALELFARVARRSGIDEGGAKTAAQFRVERLQAALSGQIRSAPLNWIEALRAATIAIEGESEWRRALARGAVVVEARRDASGATFRLRMSEGWHVNAAAPLQEQFIATAVTGDDIIAVDYPAAKQVELGFQDTPLAVLDGAADIEASLAPEAADRTVVLSLTIQACSDRICLAPETTEFRLR